MADEVNINIDHFDLYISNKKIGEIEFIQDDNFPVQNERAQTPGYYHFRYETGLRFPEHAISVVKPEFMMGEEFYFIGQDLYEQLEKRRDITQADGGLKINGYAQTFRMLPSEFFMAVPEGRLYNEITDHYVTQHGINLTKHPLSILAITGGNTSLSDVIFIEHGASPDTNLEKIPGINDLLSSIFNTQKYSESSSDCIVNYALSEHGMGRSTGHSSAGISGSAPKMVINAKVDEDSTPNANELFPDFSAASSFSSATLYDDLNIQKGMKNETGATVVSRSAILKAERGDAPGTIIGELLAMRLGSYCGLNTVMPIRINMDDNMECLAIPRFDIEYVDSKAFNVTDDVAGSYYKKSRVYELAALMNRAVTNNGKGLPYEHAVHGMVRHVSMKDVIERVSQFSSDRQRTKNEEEIIMSFLMSNLMRNSDNHLRNYAMLYDAEGDNKLTLAPMYDVMNMDIYDNYLDYSSLALLEADVEQAYANGFTWFTRDDFVQLMNSVLGYSRKQAEKKIDKFVSNFAMVAELIEEAREDFIVNEDKDPVILMATLRSLEASIKHFTNNPDFELEVGPALQNAYDDVIYRLQLSDNDELKSRYSIFKHLKPEYIGEIHALYKERDLLIQKKEVLSPEESFAKEFFAEREERLKQNKNFSMSDLPTEFKL